MNAVRRFLSRSVGTFVRFLVLAAAVASNAAWLRSAPVLPDAAAAWEFAADLKRDFEARKSAAIVERLDEGAVFASVFGVPDAREKFRGFGWEETLRPGFVGTLAVLDAFPTLVYYRLMLQDDRRQLQCEFVDGSGNPIIATLMLVSTADGMVRISDVQVGADPLSWGHLLRQILLLEGVEMPTFADGEEVRLHAFSSTYGSVVTGTLHSAGNVDHEALFVTWAKLPDDLRKTTIWRYFRNGWAISGSKSAYSDLVRDIHDGAEIEPLLRLRVATDQNDLHAVAAAVDDVLIEYQDPMLYRCVKANLLLMQGQPMKSFELYRDIIDLIPRGVIAHIGAVKAAVAAQRPDLAMEVVRHSSLLLKPLDFNRALATQPELGDLRSSKAYLEWLNPPVSATEPSAPAVSAAH